MTKVAKWWHTVGFWNKIKGTIVSLGIGSEIALYMGDSAHLWRYVAIAATLIGVLITNWIEDKNNDGIADIFQKDKNR